MFWECSVAGYISNHVNIIWVDLWHVIRCVCPCRNKVEYIWSTGRGFYILWRSYLMKVPLFGNFVEHKTKSQAFDVNWVMITKDAFISHVLEKVDPPACITFLQKWPPSLYPLVAYWPSIQETFITWECIFTPWPQEPLYSRNNYILSSRICTHYPRDSTNLTNVVCKIVSNDFRIVVSTTNF